MADESEAFRLIREKAARKAAETPEQKRARLLAKKAQKQEAMQQRHAALQSDTNRFGDAALGDAFMWQKKMDKEKDEGTFDPRNYTKQAELRRRQETAHEIEKVKRRREERESELALWEEEHARIQADQDGLTLEEWEARGHKFELDQLMLRTDNRFREQRAKPIDILVRTLHILAAGRVDAAELAQLGAHWPTLDELHARSHSLTSANSSQNWKSLRHMMSVVGSIGARCALCAMMQLLPSSVVERKLGSTAMFGRKWKQCLQGRH